MDRFLLIGTAILSFAVLGACSKSQQSPSPGEAETAGPHIATLCIARDRWPELISLMKQYGQRHSLSFHGEMTEGPRGEPPVFNYYLAAGYNYVFGDDLELWLVSNPFREGNVGFGAVPRHKPVTAEQMKLALDLLAAIRGLSTKTVVGDITSNTPEVRC